LGVDRLDYTKGIPERLRAFEMLLQRNPDLHARVTMLQVVVPSREEMFEYKGLKHQIETLISKINGQYSSLGWTPIHYFYRSLAKAELKSFYRAADVALVTPLKDGMNLVAKEFCASRVDNRGVLILSEFAGVAEELRKGAVIVNPHDTEGVASAIGLALNMSESEQHGRMEAMRSHIRTHDIFNWFHAFTAECSESQVSVESPMSQRSSRGAVALASAVSTRMIEWIPLRARFTYRERRNNFLSREEGPTVAEGG
jgi:trehalose 6-phosphate synthase